MYKKIDLIKEVRMAVDIDLVCAKMAVEKWADAFGYTSYLDGGLSVTPTLHESLVLSKVAHRIYSRDWIVQRDGIYAMKKIDGKDILNL
jgi:hypothetical protein